MKKILLFIPALFIFVGSFAQNGFFLRGQAGIGETKMTDISTQINGRMPACDCGFELHSNKPVSSVEANAELGYQYGPLRLMSGLQLIRTGSMQDAWSVAFPSGILYKWPLTDANPNYYHLLIPVSMAFKIPLLNKLSLYPEIGTKLLFISKNAGSFRHDDKSPFFTAKLSLEKELNKNTSLVLTPTYYSVTSPVYVFGNPGSSKELYSFNHVFMLQAGMLWHLPRNAKIKNGAL
jgi:hypothetical protein